MDFDLIRVLVAVAAVGVGLAGLTLAGVRGLRRDMRGLRRETRDEIRGLRQETQKEIQGLRQETQNEIQGLRQEMRDEIQGLRQETRQDMRDMRGHMGRIDSHIGELRERMAQVERLLKGLRDAFVQGITPS